MSKAFYFLGLYAVLLLPAGVAHANDSDSLLRRYEKQIRTQEKQLSELRSRLTDKERDVVRWQTKADASRVSWSQASMMIEQTSGKLKVIRTRKQHAGILADAAEWKSTENVLVSRSATTESAALSRDLYGDQLLFPASRRLTIEESAPEHVLSGIAKLSSTSQMQAEQGQKEEARLRIEEERLKFEEEARTREAEKLHLEQEIHWSKWQQALKRKTALVDDISQIDQSAKALQVMLRDLRNHLDQAQALRQNNSADDQALARLRGTLPWPAQGKVVQNYGRQYSNDLNQLVVSNGIKIEPGAHHTVRAIEAGKVLFASLFREYGPLVIIQHKNGLTSVYAGLGQASVQEGQLVTALDPIGQTAENGTFYFELRRDELPLNPLAYLSPAPSSISSRRTFR